MLGHHPLTDPARCAGQIIEAGQHSLMVRPRPAEHLGVSRGHPGLGSLQVTQQGSKSPLLITAQITHIPSVLTRVRSVQGADRRGTGAVVTIQYLCNQKTRLNRGLRPPSDHTANNP